MHFAFWRKALPEEQEAPNRNVLPKDQGAHLSWKGMLLSGGLCVLLAALFYYASYYYRDREHLAHVLQHLSTAFIVALVLMVSLEFHARRRAHEEFTRYLTELSRYRNQVAEDVFEGVLGQFVPKSVVNELKQILLTKVIKTQCEYLITLAPGKDMPPGYAILRRELSFRVVNLLDKVFSFPIESYYTSDEDLASAAWRRRPFHLKLTINGDEITPQQDPDNRKSFKLAHDIQLEPRGHADVFLRGEEPVRIEAGRSSYVQSSPVNALTVRIHNELRDQIQDVEVQMHHPAWKEVKSYPDGDGKYVLQRAFLPGQGFEVSWRRVPSYPKLTETSSAGSESQSITGKIGG